MANFYYTLQDKPLGLGHAVLCAEKYCSNSFFGLLLPDDVMLAEPTVLSQLEMVRKKYGGSVLSLEKVDHDETSRYGIVDAEEVEPGVYKIKGLVEKPDPSEAPSDLAIMGRYVLSPSIFLHLRSLKPGKGGEIQLTDALRVMARNGSVYAYNFTGKRYDTGNKLGYLKATVEFALRRPDLGPQFREYLKKLLADEK